MKKTIILTIFGFLIFNLSFGQDRDKYSELIIKAWDLYQTKDYKKSAEKYSEAFSKKGVNSETSDRYNAACSWALAKEVDSSFVQLFKIAKSGDYKNYNHIIKDSDLSLLQIDKRWNEVLALIKINKEKSEENFDKPLVTTLDIIYQSDQSSRDELEKISEKYGWKSDEIKEQWKKIDKIDSINLIKIKQILDERGWMGTDKIGDQGNVTLFLVIQHSDLETQEKYLPMLKDAVNNGRAKASYLALLEDRVALRNGRKQIYGSQVGQDEKTGEPYVLPLIDPDNVDKRRAEVGLGNLQSYLSNYNMIWDLEEYKKQLPELEAKQKK
ncbi:DUF6624 domain-containing protein [Mariniflexile sp.]|uniref:DUF6624 domain-containing protein n=1 Tax=Mariniflexile sp. TaxID=1979402 RepID=UPI003564BAFD